MIPRCRTWTATCCSLVTKNRSLAPIRTARSISAATACSTGSLLTSINWWRVSFTGSLGSDEYSRLETEWAERLSGAARAAGLAGRRPGVGRTRHGDLGRRSAFEPQPRRRGGDDIEGRLLVVNQRQRLADLEQVEHLADARLDRVEN